MSEPSHRASEGLAAPDGPRSTGAAAGVGDRPQTFSHYPAFPAPRRARLVVLSDHDCSYLPGRVATSRALWAERMAPAAYQAFMDAGFRRSGKLVYQPTCRHCRACQPIRVPVATFAPDKSQRRCARRNADLRVSNGPPRPTGEKYELYRHYLREWHGSAKNDDDDVAGFKAFLYDSPVDTIEFEYRDGAGRLLAVGICDLCPDVLSSVYFYFDPSEAARGLGTFGALEEMAFARRTHLHYYYLGYWVPGCRAMEYKSRYRPSETLCSDGLWRPPRVP